MVQRLSQKTDNFNSFSVVLFFNPAQLCGKKYKLKDHGLTFAEADFNLRKQKDQGNCAEVLRVLMTVLVDQVNLK